VSEAPDRTVTSSNAATRPRVRYVTNLREVDALDRTEQSDLLPVAARYPFRANDYYLGLIDWSDPEDPIRRLVVPSLDELQQWGSLDASREATYTVAPGVQHKYRRTVVMLCTEMCGAFCRYCFRKRLFMDEADHDSLDLDTGLAYIAAHPEVSNVLLSGGDPLLMSTRRLEDILSRLAAIRHVRVVRIGTKMPAFNPWRVLDDAALRHALRRYSRPGRRVYVMAHFDHPRELTADARAGVAALMEAGAVVVNQCPIVRGVNDNGDTLGELFQRLTWSGVQPYYLFQCRPTAGNASFVVPLVEGFRTFCRARRQTSGLGRRARYCMSHASGKIAVVGLDRDHLYLRYHQAADPADEFRFMVFRRDDTAHWVDQLVPVAEGLRAPERDAADGAR